MCLDRILFLDGQGERSCVGAISCILHDWSYLVGDTSSGHMWERIERKSCHLIVVTGFFLSRFIATIYFLLRVVRT